MDSRLGKYLWTLLPNVRRRKDPEASVLAGLLDAVGGLLDTAKDGIQTLRRRAAVWQIDVSHPYYTDAQRSLDLNSLALCRGTRRLAGETDTTLRERLQAMPALRSAMGSAMGMRYLVEEVLGHTLAGLVVYRDDPQTRIVLAAKAQPGYAERDVSHLLSAADQADEDYDPFRQTRIYSAADLDYRFQFWISIETAQALDADEKGRIAELIAQEKPAHTTCRVHFVEP